MEEPIDLSWLTNPHDPEADPPPRPVNADRMHSDDPKATAQVFDKIHSTWILVKTGQWIIRGTKGEYYPCDPDVFAEKYDHLNGC